METIYLYIPNIPNYSYWDVFIGKNKKQGFKLMSKSTATRTSTGVSGTSAVSEGNSKEEILLELSNMIYLGKIIENFILLYTLTLCYLILYT